jgi:hypothetical protein
MKVSLKSQFFKKKYILTDLDFLYMLVECTNKEYSLWPMARPNSRFHTTCSQEIRRSGYQELPILQYLLLGYLTFEPPEAVTAWQT